ncbi:MAG: hypothetical protein ACI9HK_000924 [Pirellulaceae bacterium]|jgi:hypothetical protein
MVRSAIHICVALFAFTTVTVQADITDLPLVFSDDFDKGRDNWEATDEKAWTLREVDGNNVFGLNKRTSDYQPKFRSPHNIALIKNVEVADFVLTFKVKSTLDTGNHRDCCVFFCHQDPTHFYYCHLGARPDPHSGQIMIVKDAPRLALTKNENRTPWADKWHQVKVTRSSKDGQINVYFDDMKKPHMSIKDTSYGKGRIGIGSFDDMNDFDEIRLYGK